MVISTCPNNSWTTRKSALLSKRWVAKECRRVWGSPPCQFCLSSIFLVNFHTPTADPYPGIKKSSLVNTEPNKCEARTQVALQSQSAFAQWVLSAFIAFTQAVDITKGQVQIPNLQCNHFRNLNPAVKELQHGPIPQGRGYTLGLGQ